MAKAKDRPPLLPTVTQLRRSRSMDAAKASLRAEVKAMTPKERILLALRLGRVGIGLGRR